MYRLWAELEAAEIETWDGMQAPRTKGRGKITEHDFATSITYLTTSIKETPDYAETWF